MSLPPFRVPRRRPRLRLDSAGHEWSIFLPDPDDPLIVSGFGEAALLAAAVVDLPVHHEVLVLLDAHRRVTAMLLDPPAEVGVLVGLADLPGAETPFSQTLVVLLANDATPVNGAPSADERYGYRALRRIHMAQGLLLLDIVVTDGETVRSIAIGCDPDPVWFDETPVSAIVS
ncbi:MAG: hypothetical protein ACKOA2_05445 [Ilumatobacteraceae bacterium]